MRPTVDQYRYERRGDEEEEEEEAGDGEEEEEEEEEEAAEEAEEEDDDFVSGPRRKYQDENEDERGPGPSKRARYSPSAPNGYARASPPASRPSSTGKSQSHGGSHPQSRTQPSGSKPNLEHSILNVEPLDEIVREIADFIHRLILNRTEHVEIEAKIGILRDNTGQRIRLPVGTETVLLDTSGVRFESNMSASQHQHFNKMLNDLGMPPKRGEISRTPITYHHTKLSDSFYPSPETPKDRIRVTTDESGRVVECIRKIRLGDLNIYSPKRNADWRISVNLEIPSPQPTGSPIFSRKKDRMTYTHQYCNLDLTQVRQSAGPGSNVTVQHELELEFNPKAMPVILHAATRRNSPDPSVSMEQKNEYDEVIRVFVNNARILARNAENAWESGR